MGTRGARALPCCFGLARRAGISREVCPKSVQSDARPRSHGGDVALLLVHLQSGLRRTSLESKNQTLQCSITQLASSRSMTRCRLSSSGGEALTRKRVGGVTRNTGPSPDEKAAPTRHTTARRRNEAGELPEDQLGGRGGGGLQCDLASRPGTSDCLVCRQFSKCKSGNSPSP